MLGKQGQLAKMILSMCTKDQNVHKPSYAQAERELLGSFTEKAASNYFLDFDTETVAETVNYSTFQSLTF